MIDKPIDFIGKKYYNGKHKTEKGDYYGKHIGKRFI